MLGYITYGNEIAAGIFGVPRWNGTDPLKIEDKIIFR